jgi:hypothetical protein
MVSGAGFFCEKKISMQSVENSREFVRYKNESYFISTIQ